MPLHPALWLQICCGFALLGVIWLVQLVVYPTFRHIQPEAFAAHHRHHVRRIAPVVIPLLLGELAGTVWFLFAPPPAPPAAPVLAVCTLTAWLSTFLIQVPLHRLLAQGHDRLRIEKLIASNWIRTMAWTGKAALLVWAGIP